MDTSQVSSKTADLVWLPFLTLYKREIKRFMKVVYQTIFTPFITSALYLLIFGVSLGKSITLESGIAYLTFLIPGLVMMTVLNNSFQNCSSSVVSGKFSGDLEDFKVSPLSSSQILWAMSLGGLTRGLIVSVITFAVGQIFHYVNLGSLLPVYNFLWLIFFLIIGGLSFAMLGISVAFWAKTFDQMSAVGSFVLMPLIYLGGVFFSIEGLHPFWKTISLFNPLLYLINGVRFGMLGVADVPVLHAAIVSMVSLIVFYLISNFILKSAHYKRW